MFKFINFSFKRNSEKNRQKSFSIMCHNIYLASEKDKIVLPTLADWNLAILSN